MFLLSLATLVVFIVMSVADRNAAVTKTRLLLNPRDSDVRFEGGIPVITVSQESYAIGLRLNHRPAEHLPTFCAR